MADLCIPSTFTAPTVFGAEILSLEASVLPNISAFIPDQLRLTQPTVILDNASVCNITITYTHPGQNDKVTVETWLPIGNPKPWNGRLQAVGGGGLVAGRMEFVYVSMMGAIGDGYATVTTDAGVGTSLESADWVVKSPGNVDLVGMNNFGTVSLNDEVSFAPPFSSPTPKS